MCVFCTSDDLTDLTVPGDMNITKGRDLVKMEAVINTHLKSEWKRTENAAPEQNPGLLYEKAAY